MKKLFICNTPFQCLVAMTMKYNMFSDDTVDLIITDRMVGSDELKINFEKTGLFENVYRAKVMQNTIVHSDNFYKRLLKTIKHYYCPNKYIADSSIKKDYYDAIIVHNIEGLADAMYFSHVKKGNSPKVYLFDEGYSSYSSHYVDEILAQTSKKLDLIRKSSKLILKREFMNENISGIYLLDKKLLSIDLPWKVYDIDKAIVDEKYKKMVNVSFNYKSNNEFNKENIFFEECFSTDFNNNDDLQIIERIAELVGRDNFMVKLHPRNRENRLEEMRITTNTTVGIPWEVVVLNLPQDSNKKFITYSSGSVINYKLMFNTSFKSIMLYKCFLNTYVHIEDDVLEFFEKFSKKYPEGMMIPTNEKELIKCLQK